MSLRRVAFAGAFVLVFVLLMVGPLSRIASQAQTICQPDVLRRCQDNTLHCIAKTCADVKVGEDPKGNTCRAGCYKNLNQCEQLANCQ